MRWRDYAIWTSGGVLAAVVIGNALRGNVRILDATAIARPNPDAAPHVRKRDPSKVYAVVLHQMGFSRGNDPSKYAGVTAHYIITPDGAIYQLYPWSTRLPAAGGFNSGSVSVEFVGNFPSKSQSTNPSDWWYPDGKKNSPSYQNQLTPAQARSGRKLLRKLHSEGITHVLAHRQSAGNRGNDPGPDIWGAVGQYGVSVLGMKDGGDGYYISSGRPIPKAWRDAFGIWNQIVA